MEVNVYCRGLINAAPKLFVACSVLFSFIFVCGLIANETITMPAVEECECSEEVVTAGHTPLWFCHGSEVPLSLDEPTRIIPKSRKAAVRCLRNGIDVSP